MEFLDKHDKISSCGESKESKQPEILHDEGRKGDAMLASLVPLFDENMAVKAYSLFTQKDNFLMNPMLLGTGSNDGANRIQGLEMIESMGMETISPGQEIFVPINNISVFSELEKECSAPKSRLVLLFDNTVPPVEMYVKRLKELKEKGYKLAIRKLHVSEFESYKPLLSLVDYVLLNSKKIAMDKAGLYFKTLYPQIKLCAGGIDTMEQFEQVKEKGGCQLFEGEFYRVPVTKGQTEVAPLKVNYIQLLNMVNGDNYELTKAADIIGRDTALTISLLKMVNTMARNSEITSIRHAAAMLGQRELKKWINTAVVNVLYYDKPSEITRISLLRAKFAENLAETFALSGKTDELFLMGLFSVLDIILEKSMEEALQVVKVSKEIRDALVSGKGKFAPVLEFVTRYESADWAEISRQMILHKIDMKAVEEAYMDALVWYRRLLNTSV